MLLRLKRLEIFSSYNFFVFVKARCLLFFSFWSNTKDFLLDWHQSAYSVHQLDPFHGLDLWHHGWCSFCMECQESQTRGEAHHDFCWWNSGVCIDTFNCWMTLSVGGLFCERNEIGFHVLSLFSATLKSASTSKAGDRGSDQEVL